MFGPDFKNCNTVHLLTLITPFFVGAKIKPLTYNFKKLSKT